jgi:hypothetical protein
MSVQMGVSSLFYFRSSLLFSLVLVDLLVDCLYSTCGTSIVLNYYFFCINFVEERQKEKEERNSGGKNHP